MPSSRPGDICARFGSAVRDRRMELGMSQEALAARARLNRTYVGDVERGQRNVSLRNMAKLATALNVSLPELLTRSTAEEGR